MEFYFKKYLKKYDAVKLAQLDRCSRLQLGNSCK